MRTKSLLATAAIIAAGAFSAAAQSNVYSLNIVGYVNVPVTNGKLTLIANPLKPSNGNYDVSNTLKVQDPGSDGTTLYTWDGSQWAPVGYIDGFGWDGPFNADLGKGFFMLPTATQTITFVGDVQTGTTTNVISGALSLLANKMPVGGPVPGGTVGNDGDTIFTWDVTGQQWIPNGYIGDFGWDSASTNGPVVDVAHGFFYQKTVGGNLNWITTLNP